jgi:hypothetical protein
MKITNEILIREIPIRFLPEAKQALKTWLTRYDMELCTINDLIDHVQNQKNTLWPPPPRRAGNGLVEILLKYHSVTKAKLTINIPKKYEKVLNFSLFMEE